MGISQCFTVLHFLKSCFCQVLGQSRQQAGNPGIYSRSQVYGHPLYRCRGEHFWATAFVVGQQNHCLFSTLRRWWYDTSLKKSRKVSQMNMSTSQFFVHLRIIAQPIIWTRQRNQLIHSAIRSPVQCSMWRELQRAFWRDAAVPCIQSGNPPRSSQNSKWK